MTKSWSSQSFYNKWLRSQAELPLKQRSTLTISMQEPSELVLVLETIQKYAALMNFGKVEIVERARWGDGMTVRLEDDLKEMST